MTTPINPKAHLILDYYYYATAGGARIWVREFPSIYSECNSLNYSCSGRSIWPPSKSFNSSSTCSPFTSEVRVTCWILPLHTCANFRYFIAYSYYAANYFPNLPHLGSCAGTEAAAIFGCVLLSSYLVLFINFYIQTYKAPVKGKKPIANGKANGNGVSNGAANGLVPLVLRIRLIDPDIIRFIDTSSSKVLAVTRGKGGGHRPRHSTSIALNLASMIPPTTKNVLFNTTSP